MRRFLVPAATLLISVFPLVAHGEIPDDKIKIGILQDLPDPDAGETGNGAVVAAQLAASDFEKAYRKGDAEILAETSQGGLDADVDKARDLLDKEHVAAIVSSASSAVNQRLAAMMEKRHRTLLVTEAAQGSAGKLCSASAIVWAAGEPPRMQALAQVFAKQNETKWYMTAEQSPSGVAVATALQAAAASVGGEVIGHTIHPVGSLDFPMLMSDINKTDANAVLLGETDGDLVAVLRGFALSQPQHPVAFASPYAQIADIDAAGVGAASGLVVVAPFYWDADQQSRDFAKRWRDRMRGQPVTENAATVYAATLSFLHAAKAVDDIDEDKVGAQLRRAPLQDTLFGTATIRTDGRVAYDLGVYRVKSPNKIQERWAYLTKVAAVPASQVFPPQDCQVAEHTAANTDPDRVR